MTQSVFPIYNYFCDTYIVSNVVRCRKGIPILSFPMSPSVCCVICSSPGYSSRQLGVEGHGDRVLW